MRLLGYCRVSTEDQKENTSLIEQERRIRSYCEALKHDLIEIYHEVASGSNMVRPQFNNLMVQLENFDGIIVLKLDRLSRSVKDTIEIIADLNKEEKHLIAVEQQLDTSSSSGRLFVNIMASINEYEREVINERTQRGRAAKHKAGGYAYGAPPFGYKSVNGQLVFEKTEQITIRIMRNHKRSGKNYSQIADLLNKHQIKGKRGGRWYSHTIKAVLRKKTLIN